MRPWILYVLFQMTFAVGAISANLHNMRAILKSRSTPLFATSPSKNSSITSSNQVSKNNKTISAQPATPVFDGNMTLPLPWKDEKTSQESTLVSFRPSFIVGIVFAGLSLICSISLITIAVWYRLLDNIALKIPFYFAVADALFVSMNVFQAVYLLYFRTMPGRELCSAFGASMFFFVGFQFYLMLLLATYVYFSIVKRISLDYGWCDWKMLLFCVFFAALPVIISAPFRFDAFGPTKYWCMADIKTKSGCFTLLMTASACVIVLVIIVYSHLSVLLHLNRARSELKKFSHSLPCSRKEASSRHPFMPMNSLASRSAGTLSIFGHSHSENRAGAPPSQARSSRTTKKLLYNIALFVIQWIPVFLFVLMLLVSNTADIADGWYTFCIIFADMGGILNFTAYFLNENWRWRTFDVDLASAQDEG